MTARGEYNRVLSNPDNMIVSEELEYMLPDYNSESTSTEHVLKINGLDFACSFISMVKREDFLKLTLEVPSLNVDDLFDVNDFTVVLGSKEIQTNLSFEFTVEQGKRILILEKPGDLG